MPLIHGPFISNTQFTKTGTKTGRNTSSGVLYGEEDITSLGKIPKLLLSRN